MQRICVVGTGYVGLVTGTCLADFGNRVTCVDADEGKIAQLRKEQIPFYEFSLQELVARNMREGRLTFSTDIASAIRKSRVIFTAVGTPSDKLGRADLTHVFQVARTVAENLNGYKLVVQKSTVPVGTGTKVRDTIERQRKKAIAFDVASNPEFLREGSAVEDFMRPDRIVIGTWTPKAEALLSDIYQPLFLNETPMVKTSVETAELIKYAANAFLATKISYINEMSLLCEKVGADIKTVARAMGLDGRIGSKFLHAGPGYGGSCFPKDTLAMQSFSRDAGVRFSIVDATISVNRRQRKEMISRAVAMLNGTKGKRTAILGLSFKPQTDDVRESFALSLIPALQRAGATVRAFDPVAMRTAAKKLSKVQFCSDAYEAAQGADLLVLATEWNEFRMLDMRKLRKIMRAPNLLDCRNLYDPDKMHRLGFRYAGIGRGIHLRKTAAAARKPKASSKKVLAAKAGRK
ncbi:MAG: UDP-glucose/GDP-mannose dehydrogenase family protein [Candidatus Eisenbacteria sp.]|nr:UDP-glucose/GDP-mannose dehydrogenase family protein [Candidatus Eisenbacteria bacterium]